MMRNRKGQNVAEYAILIALVIGAAMAMQTYVKRGLQGRIKGATDTNIGKKFGDFEFKTSQYEPYYANSSAVVDSSRDSKDNVKSGMQIDRSVAEATVRKGGAEDSETTSRDNQDYKESDWVTPAVTE